MFGAKNGKIPMGRSAIQYNVFGKGSEDLVIIPGLGDGFRTVKAWPWSWEQYSMVGINEFGFSAARIS